MNPLLKNFEGVYEPGSAETSLIARIDHRRLPRHIAVIMDGNGRWASQRRLPRVAGHRAGIEAVKATVEACARLTVPVLTLYAFSAENWKRPAPEVNTLMNLLREYLERERHILVEHDICFRPIGRIDELPDPVRRQLRLAEAETATNRGMHLLVALNYSGRLELVDAVNRLLEQGVPPPATEEDIERNLYTHSIPDPDLLIRTSGEMRISNFLLWQIAYSEIHVTEVLWPDFRGIHLLEAVLDFQRRERRYGGIREAYFQSVR